MRPNSGKSSSCHPVMIYSKREYFVPLKITHFGLFLMILLYIQCRSSHKILPVNHGIFNGIVDYFQGLKNNHFNFINQFFRVIC